MKYAGVHFDLFFKSAENFTILSFGLTKIQNWRCSKSGHFKGQSVSKNDHFLALMGSPPQRPIFFKNFRHFFKLRNDGMGSNSSFGGTCEKHPYILTFFYVFRKHIFSRPFAASYAQKDGCPGWGASRSPTTTHPASSRTQAGSSR